MRDGGAKGAPRHGLKNECRDILRSDLTDRSLELVGAFDSTVQRLAAVRASVAVSRADMRKGQKQWIERLAPRHVTGQRERPE